MFDRTSKVSDPVLCSYRWWVSGVVTGPTNFGRGETRVDRKEVVQVRSPVFVSR